MATSPSPGSIQSLSLQHQAQQAASPSCSPPFSPRGLPSSNPSNATLMERRGRATPQLQAARSFHSTGVGTLPSCCSEPASLYDILEVAPTATDSEIKSAYRRLARQSHPDRAPLADKEVCTSKFLQIHSAYSVLADPGRRAQYDLQLSLTATAHNTPRVKSASAPTSAYCTPRSPFFSGRGRSWETDQCWC